MSDEEKAPRTGREHTRDSQTEWPGRSIAVLKARELCEMRQFSRDLKRLKTPTDVWIM